MLTTAWSAASAGCAAAHRTAGHLAAFDSRCLPHTELPGWQTSLATCKTWDDLPATAQAYIARIEELVGVPVKWVGVGPGRDDMVNRN